MAQATCTIEDCEKPHQARGLCSTHYNRNRYSTEQRHAKTTVACDWCGKATVKDKGRAKRYVGLFCTLACRDSWRSATAGTNACPIPESHPAHPRWGKPLPVLWVAPVVATLRPRTWVAGSCYRCGKAYLTQDYTDTARYCSLQCAKRVAKQRYRARKKLAYVADVSPAKIYERDGWCCQLCGKPVARDQVTPHPLAPVPDHIVSLANGGTHEPGNVQCAHFLCNSTKGARDASWAPAPTSL